MSLNQAETFEWLRSRVQELEVEVESLRANQATEIAKAKQAVWERAIAAIADFDDWVWCKCFDCRTSPSSHSVATTASLVNIAVALEAARTADKESK